VDQKREDALAMLHALREWLAVDAPPKRVRYRFEHTTWWDELMRHGSVGVVEPEGDAAVVGLDALLDELRLDGHAYTHAYHAALARHLALDEAARQGVAATAEAVRATAAEFRRQRGLLDPTDLESWLVAHHLTPDRFQALIQEETLLGRAHELLGRHALRRLSDHLRVSGEYRRVVVRARDKQESLAARGLANPDAATLGVTVESVLAWHFARLERPVPASLDEYALQAGFADADECWRAILREYCYVRLKEPGEGLP
jgi:hypothetical protein